MAIDQLQRRKRKCGSKVRTGCGTCKIRRVKCDEAKPNCQRCSSTGRKCDGYGLDIRTLRQSPPNSNSLSLFHRISVHLPGDAEEKRGFDFFLRNTAAELSGYYDSSFWETLLLAASVQTPALRHAVVALGALHEDFSRKRLPLPSSPPSAANELQYAMNQYAKALGALRKSLSSGKEDLLTALMSCVLFVCFDSLRGCFESAMLHLQSGLRILRDVRRLTTDHHLIENKIAPLFRRLSLQSIIYVETKNAHEQTEFARELADVTEREIVISGEFESLDEARIALEQAADGLFRAFYMWEQGLSIDLQPIESFATFEKHTSQLFLWNMAFEKFMASNIKHLTSREVRGAALLKIHHLTANMIAGVRTESVRTVMNDGTAVLGTLNKKKFTEYSSDFHVVVTLSRQLIEAAEEDAKNGKQPFTFSSDFGLVGPLYYCCINCSDEAVRREAMGLLLRGPRREGMWNSELVAEMIRQFWELRDRFGAELEMGVEAEFDDMGVVHFAFFGRSTEMDTTGASTQSSSQSSSPGLTAYERYG